ncbi:MAG TPA: SDR family NAD(P)-dependent oxidoreductase [Blastocatellia bacterium]|jgi:NAD(P)-dependent dehydrogenase (short-subunit alcohol dehydrogenase family)|nr:SDR family NAD(P)-dependent oxidoreductase [Blastocatellia bacterium]
MKINHTTVAVVTGAASGIGRALAARLAQEGASLAIADVRATELNETARIVERAAGSRDKVSAHIVDVSDKERVAEFAREVVDAHGGAHLLVNNAGVGLFGLAEQLSIEDIEWLMGINFWGVVYGVKHFLPILRRQPQGHIVNISSVFGIVGPVGHSAYAASKFAVRGFTESLRHELAGGPVKVSVVHPGGIKTNIANYAKTGAGADRAAIDKERAIFNRAARTSPEAAAERIVRGILRDEERILVGVDAWWIDRIQRWAPVKYWKLFEKMIEITTR